VSHDQKLTDHYARATFADEIEASLVALGKDPAKITLNDLDLIDEFHMGGRAATREVFDAGGFAPGARLIDVGSGLGGPARVAAGERQCHVDGVDLTPAYVAVANDLSRRVGLADRTHFTVGTALSLPFDDATFDGGYTIHVGMNIADKAALMREVRRVLKPGTTFVVYDIMRVGEGELAFPLPWSSLPETSAVARPADYTAALVAAGFEILSERNRRPDLQRYALELAGRVTPPPLHHRGAEWDRKTANLAAHVNGAVLAPTEIVARVT
jgi:MPBQ/MSBQ methyltransferase